jgi:hypothetical protein
MLPGDARQAAAHTRMQPLMSVGLYKFDPSGLPQLSVESTVSGSVRNANWYFFKCTYLSCHPLLLLNGNNDAVHSTMQRYALMQI